MRIWSPILAVLALAVPAAAAEPAAENAEACVGKFRLRGTIFDFDAMAPEAGVAEVVDAVARTFLEKCASRMLVVESHATELATLELNQRLSELRAEGILYELRQRGVPADHLRAVGFGSSKPLSAGDDAETRKMNRRVTFRAE